MLLAIVIAAAGAQAASSHSALTGVDPAEGSIITQGTVITLTFNEELIEVGTELAVTDAAGVATPLVATRPAPTQVAVTMPELADGAASLAWRVVSADGHPIEGSLAYVGAASAAPTPATPSPSPSSAGDQSASASPATPSATASPQASALDGAAPSAEANGEDSGDSQGVPWPIWLALGVAVALASGTALVLRSRKA